MRWYRTIATMSPSMRYGGRRECYKQQKDILTKPSGRRQQPLVFIAPPGERHAARGHGYATDEQKNYLYTKIYVFQDETFGDEHKKQNLAYGAICAAIWKQIHEKLSQIYSNMQENNNPCQLSTKPFAISILYRTDIKQMVMYDNT